MAIVAATGVVSKVAVIVAALKVVVIVAEIAVVTVAALRVVIAKAAANLLVVAVIAAETVNVNHAHLMIAKKSRFIVKIRAVIEYGGRLENPDVPDRTPYQPIEIA